MIADDALVEYAEYVGNYYGTTEGICGRAVCQGQGRDLEIEIQGALKVRRQFPDALLFVCDSAERGSVEEPADRPWNRDHGRH